MIPIEFCAGCILAVSWSAALIVAENQTLAAPPE